MNYYRSLEHNEFEKYNKMMISRGGIYHSIDSYGMIKTKDDNIIHIHQLEKGNNEIGTIYTVMVSYYKDRLLLFWGTDNKLKFPRRVMGIYENHVDISHEITDAIHQELDEAIRVNYRDSFVMDFKDLIHIYKIKMYNIQNFKNQENFVLIDPNKIWDKVNYIDNLSISVFDYINENYV